MHLILRVPEALRLFFRQRGLASEYSGAKAVDFFFFSPSCLAALSAALFPALRGMLRGPGAFRSAWGGSRFFRGVLRDPVVRFSAPRSSRLFTPQGLRRCLLQPGGGRLARAQSPLPPKPLPLRGSTPFLRLLPCLTGGRGAPRSMQATRMPGRGRMPT